jgi:RHS repeat-associated protein
VGQYQYDAVGRRVSTTDGSGVQTFYYYDGARTIEEQSSTRATQATYVFGNYLDEVLTMDRVFPGLGSQIFYYHQDSLHSVFALTNSAGSVVERYEYDAWGRQTVTDFGSAGSISTAGGKSSFGNPFLFTGQRYDAGTGLMYYKQRYYSAALGRFISRDPAGIWTDLNNLGNGYAYVGDNPATWTDSYGTNFWHWVRRAAKSIQAAVRNVARAAAKVANSIGRAVVRFAENVVVQDAAAIIGDISSGYSALTSEILPDLLQDFSSFLSPLSPVLTFLGTALVQEVFTLGDCVTFIGDVANFAANGVQPSSTAYFILGLLSLTPPAPTTGVAAGVTAVKARRDVVIGDIITVGLAVSTGLSCATGIIALL